MIARRMTGGHSNAMDSTATLPTKRLSLRTPLLGTLLASALLLIPAAGLPAAAKATTPAPAWTITSVSQPTNFAPGDSSGAAHYLVTATNTGGTPADSSAVTITDTLPAGLTLDPAGASETFGNLTCSAGPPVSCTGSDPVPPGASIDITVPVDVAASPPSSVTNSVSVSGGGAATASARTSTTISSSSPGFGFAAFDGGVVNSDGSPATQAGSHPYQASISFALNAIPFGAAGSGQMSPDGGEPKDVQVDLPAGLTGDPTGVPQCSQGDISTQGAASCPDNTAIGTATVALWGIPFDFPVYNLVPPAGSPAQFGFNVLGNPVRIDISVRTGGDYGVRTSLANIAQAIPFTATTLTLWGVPADPSHDPLRGSCVGIFGESTGSCAVGISQTPFLTMPTSCAGPQTTTIQADSWLDPSTFVNDSFVSHDNSGTPIGADGCNQLDFSPTITAQPETTTSDSPTGLHVDLHVPQNENVGGFAEANLKQAVVTLPAGMTVNPSSADGLAGCTSAQVDLEGEGPANCPNASKIGSVEVDTPLLEHPLPGSVYLAAQGDNPFHSLLAIYIAVNDPQTGVVVKLAGHVEPNGETGQLTASFDENPQLPFEDFKLDFFGGPRAALTTPPTCGTKTTTTDLTPWTAPEGEDAHPSDSFAVASGPNGSACSLTEAEEPNKPGFSAGTTTPIAGSYSPFVLKLSRENGSQRIKGIDTTLPPGLTGKLAGIPYCSDAAIAAAANKSGNAELASPSCPLASEVGTVNVGAGSGTPFYVQGHAYLAGPYKGAPLSLAIVTPAVAGPFDLGTVVVRTALYVNETTAQIHAVSDPIPTILAGIPLDVRSIALDMNRPKFTLNPTSCNAMQVLGSATSTLGNIANLSQRFQVGACGALGFKPKLAISLKGATKRSGHPALKAVVTYPKKGAYANIAKAAVTLPASEFIDNARIGDVCTRPQFAAGKCPPSSVLGKARAFTPLLDKPLEGPVYFRSNGGERELPDIVADLNGQIHVVLVGAVDAVHKKGSEVSRVRNTFAQVPDAPVSKFVLELKGGKKGLLVNSGNLCKVPDKANVKLTAQNGKTHDSQPAVANSCGKKGKTKTSKRVGTSHR